MRWHEGWIVYMLMWIVGPFSHHLQLVNVAHALSPSETSTTIRDCSGPLLTCGTFGNMLKTLQNEYFQHE